MVVAVTLFSRAYHDWRRPAQAARCSSAQQVGAGSFVPHLLPLFARSCKIILLYFPCLYLLSLWGERTLAVTKVPVAKAGADACRSPLSVLWFSEVNRSAAITGHSLLPAVLIPDLLGRSSSAYWSPVFYKAMLGRLLFASL